jgi:hypothetical protein
VKLANETEIMKIINSRLAELALEDFGDYMNSDQKLFFSTKITANYTESKETPFSLTYNLKKFTWINSGKNFNVRFAVSTLMNSPQLTDRIIDQVTKTVKSLSLNNLLNFVKNESGLPKEDPEVSRVITELQSYIPEMEQLNPKDPSNDTSIKSKIMGFFGKANAMYDMVNNLMKAGSKVAITSKILISDDVSSIEVRIKSLILDEYKFFSLVDYK